MSLRIWKATIDWRDGAGATEPVTIAMPRGAGVVQVAEQHGQIALWYLFHDACSEQIDNREFQFFGTGHTIPDGYQYVGTVQLLAGSLVLHVLERITDGTGCPCYTGGKAA